MTSLPETMRAWTYNARGSPRSVLHLATLPTPPPPTSSDLLIRVSHCALNPAGHVIMSLVPHLPYLSPPACIPENDFSGVIAAAGPSATLTPGTPVFGTVKLTDMIKGSGALAEYITVKDTEIVKKPERQSYAEASGMMIPGATAAQMLRAAKVKAGDRVLINGASGGVGLMAVQIAKAMGATVVGVCSGPNEEIVKSVGADEVVDYRKNDPVHIHLSKTYGRKPFDTIIDCVGSQPLYVNSPSYLKPSGIHINVGAYDGQLYMAWCMTVNMLWPKILGGTPRKWMFLSADPNQAVARELAQLVDEGKLKVLVDSEFGMDQALEAYDKILTKRARGKVVVKVQDV